MKQEGLIFKPSEGGELFRYKQISPENNKALLPDFCWWLQLANCVEIGLPELVIVVLLSQVGSLIVPWTS